MNAQHATNPMQINYKHGATLINDCNITPVPMGTVAQHILNDKRRRLACKHFDIDVSLCNVPLKTQYISCIGYKIITVEPNGIIVRHLKTVKYLVYPNGDAAHMSLYDNSIIMTEYDETNSIPSILFSTILEAGIITLAFTHMTVKDFVNSYKLNYDQNSIDELILGISQEIDRISKWFITCTKLITDEKLKNKYIIKLYITDQATSQLQFNDRITNHIISHAIVEIDKIISSAC